MASTEWNFPKLIKNNKRTITTQKNLSNLAWLPTENKHGEILIIIMILLTWRQEQLNFGINIQFLNYTCCYYSSRCPQSISRVTRHGQEIKFSPLRCFANSKSHTNQSLTAMFLYYAYEQIFVKEKEYLILQCVSSLTTLKIFRRGSYIDLIWSLASVPSDVKGGVDQGSGTVRCDRQLDLCIVAWTDLKK